MKVFQSITILVFLLIQYQTGDAIPATAPSRILTTSELDYYANTKEGNVILEKEFDTIEGGKRIPSTVAELPENVEKNRYNNVLAFDETRVVLDTLPGDPHSDYINANYVDGQNRKKEYVATQGPLPHTINDFWRMMWLLNSTKIVMLTNLVEEGVRKVDQYWPEETMKYGDITVTLTSQYEFINIHHVVRTFSVQKDGVTTPRTVRHFHYTGWPDHNIPADRLSVVALIQQTRKFMPNYESPIVVHCSAGVGRTGAVILADSMIQKANAESVVNFPAALDLMRVQRVDVIENKDQYIFAHQAVADFFAGTATDDYLKNVDEEYQKIDKSMTHDCIKKKNNRFPQG